MRWGMKKSLLVVAALVALSACQSTGNLDEGRRLNWRCDAGKEFSLRRVGSAIEVYASGQTHRLEAGASEDQYSNGTVTYAQDGGRASLTGVYNGPFENCRRSTLFSWLPRLW
jgi:hypothetical protein